MTITAPPRLPDWEARLNALVADSRARPFAWGAHDCALWGAAWVQAMTGADFGADYRGRYTDAAGAAAALREIGAGTLVRTFDRHLRRKRRSFAQRGDLVLVRGGVVDALARAGAIGGVWGDVALCVGGDGLIRVDRAHWTLCWGV